MIERIASSGSTLREGGVEEEREREAGVGRNKCVRAMKSPCRGLVFRSGGVAKGSSGSMLHLFVGRGDAGGQFWNFG